MRWWLPFGLAAAAALFPVVRAYSDEPRFETDRAEYQSADIATISVSGLAACAGDEVELGFFSDPGLDRLNFRTKDVVVDVSGAASTTILMGTNTTWAGVRGDCVPGGLLRADAPVEVVTQQHTAPSLCLLDEDGKRVSCSRLPSLPRGGDPVSINEMLTPIEGDPEPGDRTHVARLFAAVIATVLVGAAVWWRRRRDPDGGL